MKNYLDEIYTVSEFKRDNPAPNKRNGQCNTSKAIAKTAMM